MAISFSIPNFCSRALAARQRPCESVNLGRFRPNRSLKTASSLLPGSYGVLLLPFDPVSKAEYHETYQIHASRRTHPVAFNHPRVSPRSSQHSQKINDLHPPLRFFQVSNRTTLCIPILSILLIHVGSLRRQPSSSKAVPFCDQVHFQLLELKNESYVETEDGQD